jgi:hypothetical protein
MILNDRSNLHFLRIAENLTAASTASKTSSLGWRKQLSSPKGGARERDCGSKKPTGQSARRSLSL